MRVPRLTQAFRTFSDTGFDFDLDENAGPDLNSKLRFEILSRAQDDTYTWNEFTAIILDNVGISEKLEVEVLLTKLRNVMKEMVGKEFSSELLDASSIHIFQMFHGSEIVSMHQMQELRRYYGSTSHSTASNACHIVHKIASVLSEDVLKILLTKKDTQFGLQKIFGTDLKYHNVNLPGSVDYYDKELDNIKNLDISFKYEKKEIGFTNDTVDTPVFTEKKEDCYNRVWLKNFMKIYFENAAVLSFDDLVATTLQLLQTQKTNEALQNELFDLLGFDRFHLIEAILEHRDQILSSCSSTSSKQSEYSSQIAPDLVKFQQIPSVARQFTVQLEHEKAIGKLLRKEKKWMQRANAKASNDDDENGDGNYNFDPEFLKTQREAFLISSMNTPLFSQKRQPSIQDRYPNVYDSYTDAKKSAAFVSGTKMSLPIGFERVNNKQYEEIKIPPTELLPTSVGKKLKQISELDDIGQKVFAGIKALNKIQSIVFDTAYHTNENLLICAPTGAGKTNVALLTIVREIKQHMEGTIIKKDEFKIIYVAPMKALASEMTDNFNKKLNCLGITAKEYTGDMQLTKTEITQTQIIVTTPEKWDVVTRKGIGDVSLTQLVRLLIFDEVHLLHGDRGPVVEALVARTLRQVESTQKMIRIVGLSATLPNYTDIAEFLGVNPGGLFFFDAQFRPVPLAQAFIGVKAVSPLQQMSDMDSVCYDKVLEMVRQGHQVMVFVHTRNSTMKTALALRELANNNGHSSLFEVKQGPDYGAAEKQMMRSQNRQLKEIFPAGFSIHHAGMLRQDRNLVERLFRSGMIKVLVCTSTLAWGVNLPAHAVIIRGTEVYDSKRGAFVDLGILDVLQIFGRAGRPQYDTSGFGTIITSHDKLNHYLQLLTCQYPIESQFTQNLADNLNAEIVLGTVCNVDEAVKWLSYTYLFVRMRQNPLVYGISHQMLKDDPLLLEYRKDLIISTARQLDKVNCVRFHERTGFLHATDLGRTASHYYIKYHTVETINDMLKEVMDDGQILAMVSLADEFNQLKVREEEMDELDYHIANSCHLPVKGGKENTHGKVNILIQTHISRMRCENFSLVSDMFFVTQNASRIVRALFEIVLRKSWPLMAGRLLCLSKVLEHRLWNFEHPLHQFSILSQEVLSKIDKTTLTIERLKEMDPKEIGSYVRHIRMGTVIKRCANAIPYLNLETCVQPITRSILRVQVIIVPDFIWDDQFHGNRAESFWIWVEDPETNYMHHSEYFILTKKQVVKKETQTLVFTIPINEPIPNQYYIRAISDRWLGSETMCVLSFEHLILPERYPPHTELLDLDPLPITALGNPEFERLYKFSHFNPIQTQVFHTLYHTDGNVLIGAPTGSGKTIAAEIAMFRVFQHYPKTKVVYIAPLKALVRERMMDWKVRLEQFLGKLVVELTGDVTPDMRAIGMADVIITTPEKWDGVSRSWQTRSYVKSVALIVIDEIHLLGEDRGPVLEVIVSRTNFISSHTDFPLRIIGLSTALANARDLADWLGIREAGLFNFRPSVRPVPLEIHIEGFPGKHYCPRMATMNKPTFQAIATHSPTKPVLVFVSSRRQTRLTALDLIAYLASEDRPKQWLHISEAEMDNIISGIKEVNLKLTLAFGIGIHHAGLQERDRRTVEELFVNQKIQVLIATATLAWGLNFPAHLVVVKGTEYYDGKTKRYVDFPITDVLQMMGRAGRPQYDNTGIAVVLVHDAKKSFYKKFIYSPFPVESSLLNVLPDHLNAEIVAGTIASKQECLDYILWTYFFRRLIQNPSYYHLEQTDHAFVTKYLSTLVEGAIVTLHQSSCLEVGEDNRTIHSSTLGRIASYYYLHHGSIRTFHDKMGSNMTIEQLLDILCGVHEYEELPVRHNEDAINSDLAKNCPLEVNSFSFDSPHTKANLLFQAHFSRLQLPCVDYVTDLKSVLDQAIRILQAMLDVAADQGWLATAIQVTSLIQMVLQARWHRESSLLILPEVESEHLYCFSRRRVDCKKNTCDPIESLPELIHACKGGFDALAGMLRDEFEENQIENIYQVLHTFPILDVNVSVKGWWENKLEEEEHPIKFLKNPALNSNERIWLQVHADQEYILNIKLGRLSKLKKQDSRAYAPRFPKPKDEGWFIILGDVENKELLALKRIGFVAKRSSCQLMFFTPEKPGRVIYTLYLLSDSYLGLDQQYDIHLDVIPSSLQAQINTEVKIISSSEDEDN